MGRGSWRLSALLAIVPIAALIVGALVDRGPTGDVRVTVFHLALTALDPVVWVAVRNSLALAATTTVGAWVIGAGLARLGRHPFRGSRWLWGLAMASLGLAPIFAALGWKALLDRLGLGAEGFVGWASAWATECLWGVPLVALAARRGLRGIKPAWEDALRLAGGGPWRIWWRIIRPIVRPHTAQAAALVFAGSLVEPVAPLVFGLRRTLACQIVESTWRIGGLNRAASLSLLALLLAMLARVALVRGRPAEFGVAKFEGATRIATGRRALAAWIGLGGWFLFAMTPLLGLGLAAEVVGTSDVRELARVVLNDPALVSLLGHSAVLGGVVATLGLLVAWFLSASRVGPGRAFAARTITGVSRLPPLIVGLGALMVPELLRMTVGPTSEAAMPVGGMVGPLVILTRGLDPIRSPWTLPTLVILGLRLPAMLATIAVLRERTRPVLFEAARSLGDGSRWSGWRLGMALVSPGLAAAWFRLAVVAGLDVSAVLLLTPSSISRTIGPGLLDLSREPGGLRVAAALALVGALANLVGLRLVARRGLTAQVEDPSR